MAKTKVRVMPPDCCFVLSAKFLPRDNAVEKFKTYFHWLRDDKSRGAHKSEYKILHDLCPENLRHKFTERSMISEYRTRNHGDLQIPKVRLEYAKRSFYFSGVKNWNDIPDNIRERDLIARFRTGLRDYLSNLSQDPNTTP